MKIKAKQIDRIPATQIDGLTVFHSENLTVEHEGQTEFTLKEISEDKITGTTFLQINGVVYNEGESFTRSGLNITWNGEYELDTEMSIIVKLGAVVNPEKRSSGGGITELPEVASFRSLDVTEQMVVGSEGPIGPENKNNLYVRGNLYTMDPSKANVPVTGPGAQGGNIFLRAGTAFCGFTRRGRYVKEDGTVDSGIRTIGFIGQVSDEDKLNNEDSVYIGTNVSRLYLYSRTAFPTIVSDKQIYRSTGITREGVNQDYNETVQTISPMATQEWTMGIMSSLGIIGGQVDNTVYSTCSPNLPNSFSTIDSMEFMDTWSRNHNWTLGTNGKFNLSGSNGSTFAPLFQKDGWNEMYLDLSGIKQNDFNKLYFNLYKNNTNAYVVRFDRNSYSISYISKWGSKNNEYNYGFKFDPKDLIQGNSILRVKYDKDNESAVFSQIYTDGSESVILTLSRYAFSGMYMFDAESTVDKLGFACAVADGQVALPTVVNQPVNFSPTKSIVSDYAVVRVKDLNREFETFTQNIGVAMAKVIDKKVEERLTLCLKELNLV